MSRRSNFLEADESSREQNLRFVRNAGDDLEQFFGGSNNFEAPPRDYKVVTPRPGFCIKTFKVNVDEKFFINVCQTEEIPAPKDVNEPELTEILQSETVSSFRVPMSISDPRTTKDKSNNPVDACDIAINPKFFEKCQKSTLFKEFFLAIISEALNEKYNIQIRLDKAIILNNRKFIGTLVPHRVRNSDVKTALNNNFANLSEAEKETLRSLQGEIPGSSKSSKPLVEELDSEWFNKPEPPLEKDAQEYADSLVPQHKLRGKLNNKCVEEILAEFYLPKCVSSKEFTLDIGEDRIVLASMKHEYFFDKFVEYRMKQELAKAVFDKTNKMLQVRIPLQPVT